MGEDEMGRICSLCGRNTEFICHLGLMNLGVLDEGERLIVK